jgi:hypothetical protein
MFASIASKNSAHVREIEERGEDAHRVEATLSLTAHETGIQFRSMACA